MSRPSILGRRRSLKHFKENISLLITESLLILRSRTDLVKGEKRLNQILRLCFREANFKLKFDYLPALDAENTKGNRPDLSWSIYNDLAASAEECEFCFALECKRLGRKTSDPWDLNEQYVKDGILRFFKQEKGYGEGSEIGAMVGYIQDWEFDDILYEVNKNLSSYELSIPALSLSIEGWQNQGISRLQHTFQRFSTPPAFLLQHFWVDMKDCTYSSESDDVEEIGAGEENIVLNEELGKKQEKKKRKRKTKKALEAEIVSQAPLQMELPIGDTDSVSPVSQDNLEF